MKKKYYFFSYTWKGSAGNCNFSESVSDIHPLEQIHEWRERHDGNSDSRLLFWKEINMDEYFKFKDIAIG